MILGYIFTIIAIGALFTVYFGLYVYGVILAGKAHPGWVVAALLFGPIPVTVAIVYLVSKKNLFLLGKD
jgi:hypothetical protein